MSDKLEELKIEAADLGISFNPRISEDKLQERIDSFYKEKETSTVVITENVPEEPKAAGKSEGKSMAEIARELYALAKATKVVTIIDNDQRVNNQTTTCIANWANQFYDMGTKRFPLNVPIEIPQGFIDVLTEVKIPHHTIDTTTGLNNVTMRRRYSIQTEDIAK